MACLQQAVGESISPKRGNKHDFFKESKHSIDKLVDTVRNHDVKRLLIDSTRKVVLVREQASREITTYLAASLMKTRVRGWHTSSPPAP